MKRSALLFGILLVFLTSCASLPTAQPPTAVPLGSIRIGYSGSNASSSPVSIAQDLNFFKKNGLDTEIISYRGGGFAVQALQNGEVQITLSSPAAMLDAVAAGADLIMIAGLSNTLYYDFVVQPGITQSAELKGKKIGVATSPGSSLTAARYALSAIYKLDPDKDVLIVPIGADEDRLAAMQTRQIDATVLTPYIALKGQRIGLKIMTALWDKNIPYQNAGVIVSRAYAKQNPQIVRAFIKSVVEATAFYRDPKNQEAVKRVVGKYLKTDDAELLNMTYNDITKTLLQAAPYVTETSMQTVLAESEAAMAKGIQPSAVIDNSFIKELDDSGYIKSLSK